MIGPAKKHPHKFSWGFLLNHKFLFVVWVFTAFAAFFLKFRLGPRAYNNYEIFKSAFANLMAERSLYLPQPELYNDMNHYGPFFGMFIAPFAMLPDWLGMMLWVLLPTVLMFFAIKVLPIENKWQSAIYLLSVPLLYSALVMQQFNVYIAMLLVFCFVAVENKREGWAALCIVVGTFVKLYGIVGLAFFFFVKRKPRFILMLLFWSAAAFCLPMLVADPSYVIGQYAEWFNQLEVRTIQNYLSFHQNISLLGVVRKVSGNLQYSDAWIMLGGVVMFLPAYLRRSQYKYVSFRTMLLASALILVVLLSSGSENSGYITAVVGVGVWLGATTARRGFVIWFLVALVVLSSLAINIMPGWMYRDYFFRYSLRAIPFTLVWLRICYELYFLDFYPRVARYKSF